MTHFEVGKTYYETFGYNGNTGGSYTVIKRTAKTVTLQQKTLKPIVRKIKSDDETEFLGIGIGSLLTAEHLVATDEINTECDNENATASQPEIADNPCFTVEPSREIERPNYTPYPNTIADEHPYVYVQPCYTPTHNNAAVVPYEHAASIRNFFHIIAIYLRLWLAMHIHTQPDVIQSHVFATWIVELKDYEPDDPHDVSPLIYKWQRKKFYEKLKLCRSQIASCKTREEIIACLQRVSSESIRLLCVADRVMNKFTRISANSECERKLAYAQIYADKIIQRREKAMTINAEIKESESITQPRSADNPDPVQEIPAQVSDISPKTYWENIIADNQNSIINFTWDDFHRDNANMHPKLQAKFYDEICKHNFALVDACKSHDEIRQLLAGSTEPALIGIMNLTYDYFGTHGEYHPKEMDSIPHMIDSLIERIDYCREDKVYWTEIKKRQSSQQPQPQTDAPKLLRLYLASDHKEYNRIRRENKARIDACDSEEGIVALMLTLDGTGILNQADYCRVSLFNADRKTDEQLAREFAAAIMKRRAKKLKASQQKTQSQPRKENPAPASDSEHTLIDTKDLHFSDRRKALEHNAAVITPCLFPEAAVALLMSISAKAIIQLGLYLGLFIAKQKGSKNAVIQEFVKRLFNLRETRSNQQNSNYATTPSQFTLHIPEGVKIVQLKNRQLGFIFIN